MDIHVVIVEPLRLRADQARALVLATPRALRLVWRDSRTSPAEEVRILEFLTDNQALVQGDPVGQPCVVGTDQLYIEPVEPAMQAQIDVRCFVALYPTPRLRATVSACRVGVMDWEEIAGQLELVRPAVPRPSDAPGHCTEHGGQADDIVPGTTLCRICYDRWVQANDTCTPGHHVRSDCDPGNCEVEHAELFGIPDDVDPH
jgi:hypothetical protein